MPRRRVLLLAILIIALALILTTFLTTRNLWLALMGGLLILTILRVYSLIRSVVWIWMRGPNFQEEMKALKNPTSLNNSKLLRIYSKNKVRGNFFPFGIRAIVLQVARARRSGTTGALLGASYRLWKYYWFVPIVSTISVLLSLFAELTTLSRLVLFFVNVLMCLGALVIAAEAAMSYMTFGSWSLAYHRFDVARERGITEFSVLVGGVVTALSANASTMFTAAVDYSAFEAIPGKGVSSLGLSLYYTLTGFTGNGDAGPRNFFGYVNMTLLYIGSAAYFLVVISLLLDSLGKTPGFKITRGRKRSRDADSS